MSEAWRRKQPARGAAALSTNDAVFVVQGAIRDLRRLGGQVGALPAALEGPVAELLEAADAADAAIRAWRPTAECVIWADPWEGAYCTTHRHGYGDDGTESCPLRAPTGDDDTRVGTP